MSQQTLIRGGFKVADWHPERVTGYEPISSIYRELSLCEHFRWNIERYVRAVFRDYRKNEESGYKYITEMVMALNWKIWEHYDKGNLALATAYDALWRHYAGWCESNLKSEELRYYFEITD